MIIDVEMAVLTSLRGNFPSQDMEDLIRLWGESEASDSAKPSSMGCTNVKKLAEIFTHLVEMEMNFYKSAWNAAWIRPEHYSKSVTRIPNPISFSQLPWTEIPFWAYLCFYYLILHGAVHREINVSNIRWLVLTSNEYLVAVLANFSFCSCSVSTNKLILYQKSLSFTRNIHISFSTQTSLFSLKLKV